MKNTEDVAALNNKHVEEIAALNKRAEAAAKQAEQTIDDEHTEEVADDEHVADEHAEKVVADEPIEVGTAPKKKTRCRLLA